jgi:hypothetical protein
LEKKLDQLKMAHATAVVLDLLSKVTFMGTDSYGLPALALGAEVGSYHVVKTTTSAPLPAPTTLKLWKSAMVWVCFWQG